MLKSILLLIVITNALSKDDINFTKDELNFIQKKKNVSIATTQDYYPFNYKENGKYEGYSIDFLKIIEKKSGLTFDIQMDSWTKNLTKFKNKEVDLIDNISYTKERTKFVNFSQTYYQIPNVLFAQKGTFQNYNGLKSLKGKKIGITQDIYYFDLIKNLNLFELVVFTNSREKMKALAFGKIDASFNNLISGQKYIKAGGYSNIKVLDEIDHNLVSREDLRIGSQKNNPILTSIIEKTINSISIEEKNILNYKWFGVSIKKEDTLKNIVLSKEEKHYLKNKKIITMCVDPNWLPLEKIQDGKHIGLVSEYMQLYSQKISTQIKLVQTSSWMESIQKAKSRECDIISLAEKTEKRSKYMNFTSPYIDIPVVIATKKEIPFISDFQEISNKKVGVVKGYSIEDKIKNKFPNVELIYVNSIDEGLKKVQNGEIFGYIDNSVVINNAIEMDYIGILSISGQLALRFPLSVATRNDEKILLDIFEKAVLSIDKSTINSLNKKWIKATYSVKTDYQLIYTIIVISILLLLASFYWNRKLNYLKNKAEEATKEKSNFLANMSHEIRTPMNAILGMTHLVNDTNLNNKQKKYIQNIQEASNNLLYIIDDILDFSKIEAAKLTIEQTQFQMSHVISNLKNILEMRIGDKNINLLIHNQLKHDQYIGDPIRLNQILINLTGNAIKFTNNGSVEVFISEQENNKILFKIKDTGIGISEENQKKLFLPFSQTDDSITRKYGGTGIGLSISKNLVHLMQGDIWINSKEGEGSEFSFTIELPKSSEISTIKKEYSTNITDLKNNIKKLKGSNILLVEDNDINRDIIHALLDGSNIKIDDAYNGDMAYNLYLQNRNKYDLILMDIQMPIKSGIEATKLIRQTNTEIPIIALSANAMKNDITKTKECGMNEHLNKPVEVDKLYTTLLKYIHIKEKTTDNENTEIPVFKTIDTNVGLKYMGGNVKLYLKILRTFYTEYSEINLDKKNRKETLSLVLSIKNISENIGALKLHDIATKLDDSFTETNLILFYSTLNEVIEELEEQLTMLNNQRNKI